MFSPTPWVGSGSRNAGPVPWRDEGSTEGCYRQPSNKYAFRAACRVFGAQVVNGGSNLTYGIRTLYAKTFERFDKWLSGDLTALTVPDIDLSLIHI